MNINKENETLLSFRLVRELLRYDPVTGVLSWRPRQPKHFTHSAARSANAQAKAWNTKNGRKPVGTPNVASGYLQVSINNRLYKAHRLIWLAMTGGWPDGFLAHANGDRSDNCWSNIVQAEQPPTSK